MDSVLTSAKLDLDLNVRRIFPAFEENPEVIFLDNASTTQKPQIVIDTIENFYSKNCSNAGRAVYTPSLQAALTIEKTRQTVATFINAQPQEVAFTSGATDSLNLVAWSWGLANLNDGDEVLVCLQDHSSAVLPWMNLQKTLVSMGKSIHIIPFDIQPVGDYNLRSIKNALSQRTKLIALSHIHHVFGQDMQIREIKNIVGPDVLISLDTCQSISHIPINVDHLGVDFVSFSGHKMFAGNGIGVLFAKTKHHGSMMPFRSGGKMASIVSKIEAGDRSAFIEKIEGGTANIPSIASLSTAIEFINSVGLVQIEKYISSLTEQLVNQLSTIHGIIFAPGPVLCSCPGGCGIVSFRFEHASSLDIASALANENIQVRSGLHCRADENNSEEYIRISMHLYNTSQDVEITTQTLDKIVG